MSSSVQMRAHGAFPHVTALLAGHRGRLGCRSAPPSGAVGDRVVGGDRILLDDGRRLRLGLVDAPDVRTGDCYAVIARDELRSLLPHGTPIGLERDPVGAGARATSAPARPRSSRGSATWASRWSAAPRRARCCRGRDSAARWCRPSSCIARATTAYRWGDGALLRAVRFLHGLSRRDPIWWKGARGPHSWEPWLVNHRYGTSSRRPGPPRWARTWLDGLDARRPRARDLIE